MKIVQSLLFFGLAGLCEIGGGYLIWLWLKEGKGGWSGLVGGLILVLYGIIATFQPTTFGRTYAAYGGVFIVMALGWGWLVDGKRPDLFDLVGGSIVLIGVLVIMFWPRP